MSDSRYTPARIEPTEDGKRLRIAWEDGAVTEYVPRETRLACPCAGCVEEMTGRRKISPDTIPEIIYPVSIHYVGRYALQFIWSDGHQTGIYPYEYLRRLADPEDG